MNQPANSAQQRTGLVVVASTRAAAGVYQDRSGPIAVEWLRARGIETPDPVVVADADMPDFVRSLFSSDQDATAPHVLLTSGGTGVSPDDHTVAAVHPLLTRELPGIAAEFFRVGALKVPTAILSGCVAGVIDPASTARSHAIFAMTLPGSRGGVKDGLSVLDGVIDHLLDQLAGADDHVNSGVEVGGVPTAPVDPPHVAEQTGRVVHTDITEQPLEAVLEAAKAATVTNAMGALITFEGTVRDHDGGRIVSALSYTCHPTATHALRDVTEQVVNNHTDVRAWVAHRIGPIPIGEMAFLVVTAAAHRGPAFSAASEIADRVKAEVPIWKEQQLKDGTTDWVGLHD